MSVVVPRISTLDQRDFDFDEMLDQEDAGEVCPMDGPPDELFLSLGCSAGTDDSEKHKHSAGGNNITATQCWENKGAHLNTLVYRALNSAGVI